MMTLFPRARRALRGSGAALLAAAVLAACGGSTSQVDTFAPSRLIVFGDEYSALVDSDGNGNGHNYAMNALDSADTTNSTLLCSDSTRWIWVQSLASHYGFTFAECNPTGLTADQLHAFMQARFGANLSALSGQVAAFQANITHDTLNSGDLVTMMIGVHDIVQIYNDNANFSADDAKIAEAEARGRLYAQQVNAVANLGPRVLATQVIDVGRTPWALSEGSAAAALLSKLSSAFNKGFLGDLINDGTGIGELAVNDTVSNLLTYGKYNLEDLACDEDHRETITEQDDDSDGYVDGGDKLRTCTTTTISVDTAATTSFWVDGLRMNALLAHRSIAAAALSLISRLPF
jgi:outer membrane lipase/esterase